MHPVHAALSHRPTERTPLFEIFQPYHPIHWKICGRTVATDMAMEATVNAVQVMGGHGYMREYPVEKMMRDAKILQIYEGTNQIMRNVIGLALNKEYSKKK